MTFEQVLPALKNGKTIAREGQSGKGRIFRKDEYLGIAEFNDDGGGSWDFDADYLLADDWYIVDENLEKILPRPVVRDGNGNLVKEEYDFRDWYLKLQEEFFEMAESSAFFQAGIEVQGLNQSYERLAEELADIITVCISYLDYLDYDEKARSELFAAVNEKNEKRGYFKESD